MKISTKYLAKVLCLIWVSAFAQQAYAGSEGKVYTERCSASVAYPTRYHLPPDSAGTVVQPRPASGYSEWSRPFWVYTDSKGRIRWWCNSKRGNFFDVGTWSASVNLPATLDCAARIVGEGKFQCLTRVFRVSPGGKAYKGWTAERTDVMNGRGVAQIRTRSGPNRLQQIQKLRSYRY